MAPFHGRNVSLGAVLSPTFSVAGDVKNEVQDRGDVAEDTTQLEEGKTASKTGENLAREANNKKIKGKANRGAKRAAKQENGPLETNGVANYDSEQEHPPKKRRSATKKDAPDSTAADSSIADKGANSTGRRRSARFRSQV